MNVRRWARRHWSRAASGRHRHAVSVSAPAKLRLGRYSLLDNRHRRCSIAADDESGRRCRCRRKSGDCTRQARHFQDCAIGEAGAPIRAGARRAIITRRRRCPVRGAALDDVNLILAPRGLRLLKSKFVDEFLAME